VDQVPHISKILLSDLPNVFLNFNFESSDNLSLRYCLTSTLRSSVKVNFDFNKPSLFGLNYNRVSGEIHFRLLFISININSLPMHF